MRMQTGPSVVVCSRERMKGKLRLLKQNQTPGKFHARFSLGFKNLILHLRSRDGTPVRVGTGVGNLIYPVKYVQLY
jgi:hypothetical protein